MIKQFNNKIYDTKKQILIDFHNKVFFFLFRIDIKFE